MEWYQIIGLLLGAFGGISGFVSLYNAKSNKQTIDIHNMSSMLEEAHKMFTSIKDEKDNVVNEFRTYKNETMQYIADFKNRFSLLEKRLDKAENDVLTLKRSIYQGYRCKFPTKIEDCPVLKEYEKIKCTDCAKYDDGNNEIN